jgi:hypothetical protein
MAKTLKSIKKLLHKTMKAIRGGAKPPKTPADQSLASWQKWVEKYKAYLEKEGKPVPVTLTWEEHKALPRYRNSRGQSVITMKGDVRGQELKWMHDVYHKLTGKTHKTLSRRGLF